LRATIQQDRPDDNITQLQLLPKRRAILKVFAGKKKRAKIEDFDPLQPPERLFVGSNF